MAKFPVESDDNVGVIDALNYLLSGPQGLGQDFNGVSFSTPAWLTGNIRPPYSSPYGGLNPPAYLYVSLPILTTELIDNITIKCTFATQPSAPFILGNGPVSSGITGFDSLINLHGQTIGIIECTTTYCLIRLDTPTSLTPSIASGGTLTYTMFSHVADSTSNTIPTDCNAYAQVTGATDRVYISSQLDLVVDVVDTSSTQISVIVSVERFKAYQNTNIGVNGYNFIPDATVISKSFDYDITTSTRLPRVEAIFTNFIDNPAPGYYWYILSVEFTKNFGTDAQIALCEMQLRSLSTQVVKQ